MTEHRVLKNVLIMGSGQIVTWIISLAYLTAISRYLGPGRLGELTQAWAIAAIFALMIQLGMDTLITRTVARRPERAGTVVSAALIVRCGLSIPIMAAVVIYVHAVHLNAEATIVTYIIAGRMVVTTLSGVALATFQGREHMSLGTIGQVLQNIIDLALAVIVIVTHAGVIAFATSGMAVALLLSTLYFHWMRRYARLTIHVSRRDLYAVVEGSLAFWASSVFLTIYIYVDSIILQAVAGAGAVGIYSPAVRIFAAALFLPGIIGQATLPLLSRLGIDARGDFLRVGRKTLSLLIVCGIPLAVGLATFASPLMLTIFGPAYRESAPVLVVLSLCIIPTFLTTQLYQMVVARDQQARWTAAMAVSCVINPALNLTLIPYATHHWHNGALGAALALLATECALMLFGIVIVRDVVFDRGIFKTIVGALTAGGTQVGIILLTGSISPLLAQGLGAAGYVLVALLVGVLQPADLASIMQAMAKKPRNKAVDKAEIHSASGMAHP